MRSVAMFCILAKVTASFAIVAAKDPVPLPVTSPVRVIVWSPVLVPLLVPLNVPLCVASDPRPRFVRAVAAFVRSLRLLAFTHKPLRSWSPVLVPPMAALPR